MNISTTSSPFTSSPNGLKVATSSLPDSDSPGGRSTAEVVAISIIAIILMLVTVVGNFLVIWSYRINRRLRDINNMFLVSLACSDLVIGIVSMNLYPITMIREKWLFGEAACTTWLSIDYTMSMASVANLLLICFDRYFSVTKPFTYRPRRTRSRAQIMIVSAWIFSFLLFTPLIVVWPFAYPKEEVVVDPLNNDEQKPPQCLLPFYENKPITIVTALFAFFIPIVVMAVMYGIIFVETRKCAKYLSHQSTARGRSNTVTTTTGDDTKRVGGSCLISPSLSRKLMGRRSTHQTGTRTSQAQTSQLSSSERKAARTLSAILVAFFVTWLPYNVCTLLKTILNDDAAVIPSKVWEGAYYLCYINSTINPCCYALCNKTFRRTFVQILSCRGSLKGKHLNMTSKKIVESSSSSHHGNHGVGGRSSVKKGPVTSPRSSQTREAMLNNKNDVIL